MYQASANGYLAIVKVLIEAGSNVNQARTTDGGSPLLIAAENGKVDVVKVLIKAGGNVNQARTDGIMPLRAASRAGQTDIVRLLLEQPNINTWSK